MDGWQGLWGSVSSLGTLPSCPQPTTPARRKYSAKLLRCSGVSTREDSCIFDRNEQNHPGRTGGGWDVEQRGCQQKLGDGSGEQRPSLPPPWRRPSARVFHPPLHLPRNDCFQQEFGYYQPKCHSKKISLDSSGIQKQGANG